MKRKPLYLMAAVLFLHFGLTPVSHGAQTPDSSPESATRIVRATDNMMGAMHQGTKALIDMASNTIDNTRAGVIGFLGGPESWTGWAFDWVFSLLTGDLLGWPVWQYFLSIVIIFFSLTLRYAVASWILNFFIQITSKTKTKLDDELVTLFRTVIPPLRLAIAVLGIYIAVEIFFAGRELPDLLNRVNLLSGHIVFLILVADIAWALCLLVDAGMNVFSRVTHMKEYFLDQTFEPIIKRTVKTFIIIVALLQGLNHLEFGTIVTSIMAAAGVSGLAIGLAAQDTIKNFFGSIVLLADRPFSVGDWVVAGGTEGIIESVGIRSTKIRTFGKTLITIPNSSIVDRDIENISRRKVRRIKFYLGVSYRTQPAQMEELLKRIRRLLRDDPDVWPSTILVRFTEFADSALNIFIYYFSKTTVWDEHLAVREKMNLSIMRIVEEMGLEIAYPTQTVYLRNDNPPSQAAPRSQDTNPSTAVSNKDA